MRHVALFLQLSGVLIGCVGLAYGLHPDLVLAQWVGLTVGPDTLQIFRAIMGLYLGIGGLLIAASLKPAHYQSGLWLLGVFMAGLAGGRVLSLLVDGYQHWFALLATGLELGALALCAWYFKQTSATAAL